MKTGILSGILLCLGVVFAQLEDIGIDSNSNNDYGDIFKMSGQCTAEGARYAKCLMAYNGNGINADAESITLQQSKEDIEKICTLIEKEECKNFLNDINLSTSDCLSEKSEVFVETMTGMTIMFLRFTYLNLCAKDGNGNICPLSKYLLDNMDKSEITSSTEAPKDMLNAMGEDCRNRDCNNRMKSINNIYTAVQPLLDTFDSKVAESTSNVKPKQSVTALFNSNQTSIISKYFSTYNSEKCGTIDGTGNDSVSGASTFKIFSLSFTFIIIVIVNLFTLL